MTYLGKLKKAIKEPKLISPYLRWRVLPSFRSLMEKGYAAPPVVLGISVNSVCNANCVFCDIGQKQKDAYYYQKAVAEGGELSLDVLKKTVNDVKRFHPWIQINLTEPLLYHNLGSLVEYIVENGLKCSVTTNGILLEQFADEFVEKKLTQLYVSVNGPSDVHNRIKRVPGAFEKAYRGIKRVLERRGETKERLPRVEVACAISDYNYDCLEETVTIFKELGVDGFAFEHLTWIDAAMAKAHNDNDTLVGMFGKVAVSSVSAVDVQKIDAVVLSNQLRAIKSRFGDFARFGPNIQTFDECETYYHKPMELIGQETCTFPCRIAHIHSNGDVMPASRCFHYVMGNIYKEDFPSIWNEQRYKEFRRNIRKVGTTPICSRCRGILP